MSNEKLLEQIRAEVTAWRQVDYCHGGDTYMSKIENIISSFRTEQEKEHDYWHKKDARGYTAADYDDRCGPGDSAGWRRR